MDAILRRSRHGTVFVPSGVFCLFRSLHSVRFCRRLRCPFIHIVNIMKTCVHGKEEQATSINKKYRIYSRLLFRTEASTRLACLRLDSRYIISLFDSNHFIGDTSPLFWKVLPRCACSISANSTIICYSSLRF